MKFEEKIIKEIPADDSTSHGEKMILYWLIRELKPKVVVETGTHRGMTSLYLAHALYDNGEGHLHTCDPFDQWGQVGNFRKVPELEKYITFYNIRGKELLKKVEADFAFIDGFHEKKDVLPEIESLKLSKHGVAVFHDCWPTDDEMVNKAIEESNLKSVWLPTKNAIQLYCKFQP